MHFNFLLLVLTNLCNIDAAPAAQPLYKHPLNAKSFVLAESNQHDVINKSIKSIFVVPDVRCRKGYVADSSGACRKVIEVDEKQHWDFILDQLNKLFGDFDYDESFDKNMPYSIDIPIDNKNENYDYFDDTLNGL